MIFPNNHPYEDIGMYLVLSNDKSCNCQTLDLATVDLMNVFTTDYYSIFYR